MSCPAGSVTSSHLFCDISTNNGTATSGVHVTGGSRGCKVPPRDFWPGKKGKRSENWEENKENYKRESGKLKMEGEKVTKMRWELFLFSFFFLLLTFQNPQNLFWVYQNGNFLQGKSISCWKKIRKILCPLRKIFLLHPWLNTILIL